MQEEEKKMNLLREKSHETLLKFLNNIGIIGAVLAGIADIIFVIIFVVGIHFEQSMSTSIIYAVVNACIGILINVLLRYQGQKYAEIENEELCKKFYKKQVEKEKKHLSMTAWNIISTIRDIIVKGCTTTFTICGVIYISIEGSKNPIQILMTLVTLVLFTCFGLMNMNSAYCRYYNIQVPIMEKEIKNKGEEKNGAN